MKKIRLLILLVSLVLMTGGKLRAQEVSSDQPIYYSTSSPEDAVLPTTAVTFGIKEISITGNRRTRRSTILRELPFQQGEAYPLPEIIEKLELSKQQLMNTSLFRNVIVTLRSLQETNVYITVDVEERWYFYPQPFVRVANGTFSQWNERGRKIEHLSYGIKLSQYNFSGRGDKLHLHFADGYTKKIGLQYQGFFLDRELKWSSSINFMYGKNREINYATENNKLLPVRNPDGYLYEFSSSSVDVTYRPAIKTRHQLIIGYNTNRVADTIHKLNALFSPSANNFSYPYITYNLRFLDFDLNPYPTRGKGGEVSLQKAGLGGAVNLWELSAKGARYWPIGVKSYFGVQAGGTLKLPFKQPYFTQGFMGYGDNYLQGYENYIIDGVAGGYAKATFGYTLFKKIFTMPDKRLFKLLRTLPLQVYAKSYVNTGYVHNPNLTLPNYLNNRMLYSGGFGVDIVLFAAMVIKFEWSFNQLGQNALYLHQ